MKIAVFCVGNRLMLDDGIGPAVYDELVEPMRSLKGSIFTI